MHIQTMHPKTHRATYEVHISPGSHECEESGRALGRVQIFSFVAFKVQIYDFFLAAGGNQSSPLRRQIALSEPISFGEAIKLPRQYNQHSCVPSLHLSLLGFRVH